MIELNVSFTDFWEGHDPRNNILTNIVKDALNVEINKFHQKMLIFVLLQYTEQSIQEYLNNLPRNQYSGWGKM